jgi:hypothetical protein
VDIAKLILDYVRVVLSPQMIAGAVSLALLALFKGDLRLLLARMAKLRLPGGGEFTLQVERSRRERALPNQTEPLPTAALPERPTEAQVSNTIAALQADAQKWEFRYLNCFLASDTQWVLDWIAGATDAKLEVLALLYTAPERAAILDALRTHRIVEQEGEVFRVTDKGRDYLKFRGPRLPPPPGAGS